MSRIEDLLEDYATKPVPQEKTYSGLRIGFVLGGIGIALPALLSGAKVGAALGFEQSLHAFVIAGVLVTAMGLTTAWVGMRSRLSTYMILQFSFGPVGSKLVNLTFAISQFGWFGVNAFLFGEAAESIGENALGLGLPSNFYVISGGVLMTASTIFGFKALDKLALVAVPVLLATLSMMIARTFGVTTFEILSAVPGDGSMTMTTAVTALAGGIIVGVVLIPDLTRYARGPVDVVIAVLIALAIVEPLVHTASAAPALMTGETDPLSLMLALGFGGFALFILVITSWTTNAVNLYGSGLSLTAIVPRVAEWRFIALAGVIGTTIAMFNVHEWFIDFLIWQSILFSSVVGVYVIDFFFIRNSSYDVSVLNHEPPIRPSAFFGWAVGATIATLAHTGYLSATTMPSLDGALAAAAAYFIVAKFIRPTAK